MSPARLRLLTWNVRHCRGLDRRVLPARILSVLEALSADVIALQEIDVAQRRSGGIDQPAWLAERLGLSPIFCETVCNPPARYGHVLLSRLPVRDCARVALPGLPGAEPRAALSASLALGAARLRVITTHLGLSAPDRGMQVRALREIVEREGDPIIVLGDLNAGPGHVGFRELAVMLRDPFVRLPLRARATWPALWPFRALDHVLLSPSLEPHEARVLSRGAARFASDHRPVVVDVVVAAGTTIAPSESGDPTARSERSTHGSHIDETSPGGDRAAPGALGDDLHAAARRSAREGRRDPLSQPRARRRRALARTRDRSGAQGRDPFAAARAG